MAEPTSSTRGWIVWGVGGLAYAVAVMQRSSLGVMGLTAAAHFHATAGIVATFMVLQLAVYALGQVPAGLLLDRLGPRFVITLGAVLMTGGQALIATADNSGTAILARILVGAGDACTYSSAIRLIPAWFPVRRVPLLTQVTSLLGQLGQIGSTVGLVAMVGSQGWRATYLLAAAVGAVAVATSALLLRDAPPGAAGQRSGVPMRGLPRELWTIAGHPATGMAFWSHWTTNFPGITWSMMWGMPYITHGEGRSTATASTLMTIYVLMSATAGPFVARLTQRHPLRRSSLVILMIAVSVVPWIAVLAWPGRAPLWLLVVLTGAIGVTLPGGAVGFDVLRTEHEPHRLGTATGIAIMGGFIASLILIQVIGLMLDWLCPGGRYTLSGFRWSMGVQMIFYAVGIGGIVFCRRRLRARVAAAGTVVPSWRQVIDRERKERRSR